MYGKALFFVVLVVLGAVLPYLLADDAWLARIEEWAVPTTLDKTDGNATSASQREPTKPATIGKLVPIETYDSRIATTPAASLVPSSAFGTATSATMGDPSYADSGAGSQPRSFRDLELPRVNGPPGVPIESLLSFEVTPDWISKHWSRVTTRLADLGLQGWRVPVAVDEASDFIGSVTYYFDRQRNVQRIQLHGYTSDASNLVRLSTSRYDMRRVPNTLTELYAAVVQGQTIGGLRVEYKPILKSNMQKSCEVLMELNRQQTRYGMSNEFTQTLKQTIDENRLLTPITSPTDVLRE